MNTQNGYEQRITDLEHKADLLQAQLAAEKRLNANLIRICRERSNSDRGLTPKKKLAGYVIRSSVQVHIKQVSGKSAAAQIFGTNADNTGNAGNTANMDKKCSRYTAVWKTVIETPFDCSIPLDAIEGRILQELDAILMPALGISRRQDSNHNGEFRIWTGDDGLELNGIYSWTFVLKPPYWQIIIIHNKSITLKGGNII